MMRYFTNTNLSDTKEHPLVSVKNWNNFKFTASVGFMAHSALFQNLVFRAGPQNKAAAQVVQQHEQLYYYVQAALNKYILFALCATGVCTKI